MSQRFSYIKYDDHSMALQQKFRDLFESIEHLTTLLPNTRHSALVFTRLEEAYMWVGKAIRDAQIARTGTIDEQPERCDD